MLAMVEQIVTAARRNLQFARTDLLMNPDRTPKLGKSDLLYGSTWPTKKKVDVNRRIGIFKPVEPHSSWRSCQFNDSITNCTGLIFTQAKNQTIVNREGAATKLCFIHSPHSPSPSYSIYHVRCHSHHYHRLSLFTEFTEVRNVKTTLVA